MRHHDIGPVAAPTLERPLRLDAKCCEVVAIQSRRARQHLERSYRCTQFRVDRRHQRTYAIERSALE